jgi:hypothetical protein
MLLRRLSRESSESQDRIDAVSASEGKPLIDGLRMEWFEALCFRRLVVSLSFSEKRVKAEK